MTSKDDILEDTLEFLRSKTPILQSQIIAESDLTIPKSSIYEINKKIAQHQQIITKHLIKSNQLEKKRQKAIIIEEECISDLRRNFSKFISKPVISKLQINDTYLRDIDVLIGIKIGISTRLYDSILNYNDKKLYTELNSLPKVLLINMNVDYFIKIASFTSKNRLSHTDIIDLYKRYENLIISNLEIFSKNEMKKWELLMNMLLKQIKYIYLINELYTSNNFNIFNTTNILITNKKLNVNDTIDMNTNINYNLSLSNQLKMNSISTSSNNNSKSSQNILKVNRISKKINKNNINNHYNDLNKELIKSKEAQMNLSVQLASQVTKMSQTTSSLSLQYNKYESAKMFSKHIGLRKVENILFKKSKKIYKYVILKFKNVINWYKFESIVMKSCKYISLYKLYYFILNNFQQKIYKYFHMLKCNTLHVNDLEEFAAIIEIQKMFRSKIAKIYVNLLRKINYIIQIQKISRGYLGRKIVMNLRRLLKFDRSCILIQKWWKRTIWKRSVLKLLKIILFNKKAILIQKVYRGHNGRNIHKKLIKKRHRIHASIKIQCLWRKYKAICILEKRKRNYVLKKQIILIQSVIRGFLARLYVKDLREHMYLI